MAAGMKTARTVLLCAACLMLSGCASLLPEWRLFQKKVPAPIVKPASQVETERRTADYIARTVEQPPQLKGMARDLSESLGKPEHPIAADATPDDAEERMAREWQKALRKQQEQLDQLNALLAASEGKKIEDTGINVFGFSVGAAGLALVVLCVMFPPLATILWAIFKRVSGALHATAQGIANFVKDNPDAGEKLKDYLSKTQDAAHKQIIRKLKSQL